MLIIVNFVIVIFFVIWMIKGYIDVILIDSEEVVMIDGVLWFRVIWDIVLLVVVLGILILLIFCFILIWNEFLFLLILIWCDVVMLLVGFVNFCIECGDLWELMSVVGVMIIVLIFIMVFFI